MMANKLKDLVSLAREAVKGTRRVVDELVNNLGHNNGHVPQPELVRIPIRPRNVTPTPRFRNPLLSSVNNQFVRNFSSTIAKNNYRNNSINPILKSQLYQHSKTLRYSSRSCPQNFAQQLWPYSAFRGLRRPPFPNGLYRNFVGINARNFSTYGSSFSREAVESLTASLRCFLNNGGELGSKMMNNKSFSNTHNYHHQNQNQNQQHQNQYQQQQQQQKPSYLSYDGCASQNEASKTLELARRESSMHERSGVYVEFPLPSLELRLPSISFINDEILDTIESGFEQMKASMDKTNANIQRIFDSFGSLPLERRRDLNTVRVHFPNLDAHELEKFLVELNIHEGFVRTNDDNDNDYGNNNKKRTNIGGMMFTDDGSSDLDGPITAISETSTATGSSCDSLLDYSDNYDDYFDFEEVNINTSDNDMINDAPELISSSGVVDDDNDDHTIDEEDLYYPVLSSDYQSDVSENPEMINTVELTREVTFVTPSSHGLGLQSWL